MRDRVNQVVAPAHWGKLAGSKVIERQVNGAAPAVTRFDGHVSLFEHVGPADIRVVPWLRPAVLRLLRPAQEAVDGALRAVTVPQQQAKAKGGRLVTRPCQGCAQGPRAGNAVGQVPVDRLAGEVVPGGV